MSVRRPTPLCFCGRPCRLGDSSQLAPQKAQRLFFCCSQEECGFFDWVDSPKSEYKDHYEKTQYPMDEEEEEEEEEEKKTTKRMRVDQNDDDHEDDHDDDDPNPSARFRYLMRRKTDLSAAEFCKCGVCLSPMVEPRATACQHSFCQFCLLQLVEKGMPCPVCRGPLDLDTLHDPDPTLLILLSDLEVFCMNRARGCKWTGPRGNLQAHCSSSCQYQVALPKLDWVSVVYSDRFSIHKFCRCVICLKPMLDPVETPCHHAYCRVCIVTFLNGGGKSCPSCGAALAVRLLMEANWTLRGLLDDLVVLCPNKCSWSGKRLELETHFTLCSVDDKAERATVAAQDDNVGEK